MVLSHDACLAEDIVVCVRDKMQFWFTSSCCSHMMIIHMFQPLCTVLQPQTLALSKCTACRDPARHGVVMRGCCYGRLRLSGERGARRLASASVPSAAEFRRACPVFLEALCGSSSPMGAAVQAAAWGSIIPGVFPCFAKPQPQ